MLGESWGDLGDSRAGVNKLQKPYRAFRVTLIYSDFLYFILFVHKLISYAMIPPIYHQVKTVAHTPRGMLGMKN